MQPRTAMISGLRLLSNKHGYVMRFVFPACTVSSVQYIVTSRIVVGFAVAILLVTV